MRLPFFDYRAPATLDEALSILGEKGPAAAVIGGGTDLVPRFAFAAGQTRYRGQPQECAWTSGYPGGRYIAEDWSGSDSEKRHGSSGSGGERAGLGRMP